MIIPLVAFLGCLLVLAVSGLHMLELFLRAKRRPASRGPFAMGEPAQRVDPGDVEVPVVTVQVAICDEAAEEVEATVATICALDHPRDRLEIQLCDDSTRPETIAACERLERRFRAQGLDIHHLRRPEREGYKPGNLNHAMRSARGELIAIFDADFRAPPDLLTAHLPVLLGEPDVAMVQTYFRHRNHGRSLLHEAIEGSYEVHLLLEQQTWSDHDIWMHFNGSAGIWRREALEAIGGWPEGGGVEDVQASYLAELAGWRMRFSTATTSTAMLPDTLGAYRDQQRRWAVSCGAIFRALFLRLLFADARWASRQNAIIKIGSYFTHAAMGGVMLLTWPAMLWLEAHPDQGWLEPLTLVAFAIQALGHGLAHAEASRRAGHGLWSTQLRGLLVSLQQTGIALMVGSECIKGFFGGRMTRWRPSNATVRRRGQWGDWLLEWAALGSLVMAVVVGWRSGHLAMAIPALVLAAGIPFLQLAPHLASLASPVAEPNEAKT